MNKCIDLSCRECNSEKCCRCNKEVFFDVSPEYDICSVCENYFCADCFGGYENECKSCRPSNWLELAEKGE